MLLTIESFGMQRDTGEAVPVIFTANPLLPWHKVRSEVRGSSLSQPKEAAKINSANTPEPLRTRKRAFKRFVISKQPLRFPKGD
jgi:hypothetical protein